MFYSVIYLLFLSSVILSLGVLSSPLSANGIRSLSGSALIDCTDGTLLKRLETAKIPYRCIDGTDKRSQKFFPNFNSFDKTVPEEELIILESVDCIDPERCGTRSVASVSEIDVCQPDFMFVPALGECVPRPKKECKEGYFFEFETERCRPISRQVHYQSDEPVKPSSSSHKCPQGYVYSPEIDRCQIIIRPPAPVPGRPQAASLVMDKPDIPISDSTEIVGKKKCTKGMVYVSELDICVAYVKPPGKVVPQLSSQAIAGLRHRRSLINDSTETEPAVAAAPDHHHHVSVHIGKKKCASGQVYISEVDHCVDYEKPN